MATGDPVQPEWRDNGQRADQVLTMIAAILLDRAGGKLQITRQEWDALNARYGGEAAVMFSDNADGRPIDVWIDTIAGVAQLDRTEGRTN